MKYVYTNIHNLLFKKELSYFKSQSKKYESEDRP